MATFTIVADIGSGDETSLSPSLFYKIYNDGILYYTSGTANNDANVSLAGTTVTIINVPKTGFSTYNITIAAVDEAHNESDNESNEITLGVITLFEEGLFEPGLFA